MKKILNLILTSFLISSVVFAMDKFPAAVDEYAKSLQISRINKNVTIEQTYIKGLKAMNSVEEALGRNEADIDSKWLKSLRLKMEGIDLNPNTETYVADAKLDFFLALAKKNGTAEDIAFFKLNYGTYPHGAWPIYLEQRTDLKGCTIYNGTLTKSHRSWTNFHNKYPHAYAKIAKAQIENIEQELAESDCSCTEKAEPILTELQSFIKENPKLPLNSKIQKRIREIKSKTAPIPGCKIAG